MTKFYERYPQDYEEGDITNDNDLRYAIVNKVRHALDVVFGLIQENQYLYDSLCMKYGEEAFNTAKKSKGLLEFSLYYDAFTGLIVSELYALLGQGKQDKLSIWNNKAEYNGQVIDNFYARNANQLKSTKEARNKIFAHIDTEVTDTAFQYDFNFLFESTKFLLELFSGKKHI